MSDIKQTEKVKQKIELYKNILDDLTEKLANIDSERFMIIQNIHSMQEYLESYEKEYSLLVPTSKQQEQRKMTTKLDLSKHSIAKAIKAVLELEGKSMNAKDIWKAVEAGGKKTTSKRPENMIYAIIVKRKTWFRKVSPGRFTIRK